jgi:hypothetical protein
MTVCAQRALQATTAQVALRQSAPNTFSKPKWASLHACHVPTIASLAQNTLHVVARTLVRARPALKVAIKRQAAIMIAASVLMAILQTLLVS